MIELRPYRHPITRELERRTLTLALRSWLEMFSLSERTGLNLTALGEVDVEALFKDLDNRDASGTICLLRVLDRAGFHSCFEYPPFSLSSVPVKDRIVKTLRTAVDALPDAERDTSLIAIQHILSARRVSVGQRLIEFAELSPQWRFDRSYLTARPLLTGREVRQERNRIHCREVRKLAVTRGRFEFSGDWYSDDIFAPMLRMTREGYYVRLEFSRMRSSDEQEMKFVLEHEGSNAVQTFNYAELLDPSFPWETYADDLARNYS